MLRISSEKKFTAMNRVIYTAIFSNYEELKRPTVVTEGWKYVCFSDQPITSDVWHIEKVEPTNDPLMMARCFKINGSRYFGHSIWVDGSFIIKCNLDDFWRQHFKYPMTVIPHPFRDNVYAEIKACIKNNRADVRLLNEQYHAYKQRGITGSVIQSGVLLRENSKQVIDFCNLWWKELTKHSPRDQIAFAAAEYLMPGIANRTAHPFDYRNNDFFTFINHYHRRNAHTH